MANIYNFDFVIFSQFCLVSRNVSPFGYGVIIWHDFGIVTFDFQNLSLQTIPHKVCLNCVYILVVVSFYISTTY